ncbi:hypothetical protein Metho_1820 [Methanomethylovorans hollandica DSM 15978]|uniref:Uncharacterized protein n=1 Tax=Methanomethylovorans hollandica (strain DSM 15978 / NBRC 107637 / DMS1) TaxID=867904 RepID=L0KX33_METHD|nr:hypothetical protein [Methanomethylovorans hollandica]AGB50002.1 hypothetical protein Metho_1820 [Methanomethylovorans hollandica DSM 15978]
MNSNENLGSIEKNIVDLIGKYNSKKLNHEEISYLKKAGKFVLLTDEHIYNKLKEQKSHEEFIDIVDDVLNTYNKSMLGSGNEVDEKFIIFMICFMFITSSNSHILQLSIHPVEQAVDLIIQHSGTVLIGVLINLLTDVVKKYQKLLDK